eukprot:UN18688
MSWTDQIHNNIKTSCGQSGNKDLSNMKVDYD